MSWREEFDESFDVPELIEKLEGVEDMSWHNDVCPSFGVRGDEEWDLRIWVQHPDPEQRETYEAERYMVQAMGWSGGAADLLSAAGLSVHSEYDYDERRTDSPAEAAAVFMLWLERIYAARRKAAQPC